MAAFLTKRAPFAAAAALAALALAGCSAAQPATTASTAAHDEHADHDHDEHGHDDAATEASGPQPRLALTYDGGIMVVDATSLEVVADLPIEGFNRVNPAGDGRHVYVSTTGGWAVLDLGTYTQPHGDHTHSYTSEPQLTDVLVDADTPGHVVNHDGKTALFDDGTGNVTVLDTAALTEQVEAGSLDPLSTYTTDEAHHGVAVPLADDTMFVTVGDEESRSGAMVIDAYGNVIASSDECPGIHGETTVGSDLVLAGCEDGALLSHGDHFHKITSPDDFGRIGNAFTATDSNVVLGDYKTDPDGGNGLTQISLIDTVDEEIQLVDTGSTYTWRGLARGEDGEALVLGTDGVLRVFDADSGELIREIEVTDEWEVPEEWQTAHPAITQHRGYVYVTNPDTSEVSVVDYTSGEVTQTATLPHASNELALVSGDLDV
jgi:DNA-binding beta-propeller fold protein YncE